MRYSILLVLFAVAALMPVAPATSAQAQVEPTIWVCAGYFEKRVDQAEASYGIRNYRERFLATKRGALRRAVFVFPVAFRIMREHLRSQAATRFGEASFQEIAAFDPRTDIATQPEAKAAKPGGSPAPGDQIAALPADGVRIGTIAAVRFTSKRYNGVPSKNGWSELTLVALDGQELLGMDSTLVAVWRNDSAEEWGTGDTGSLFSFGRHRVGKTYVTSTEFALMDRLRKLYSTPFTVLPLSPSGPLNKDAVTLSAARAWLEKYESDPGADLQARNPGGC